MRALRYFRRVAEATGMLVLAGFVLLVLRFDDVASFAANRILANAIPPEDREPPPTPGALPYTSADIQVIGGRGEGLSCSLPPILDLLAFRDRETPIGIEMHQACAFHDYCYRHGAATYGYTQADCDFLLQEHAYRLCTYITNNLDKDSCRRDARLITLGVRAGGSDSFRLVEAGEDDKASTYFEFDSYPTRTSEFVAYRIADAPAAVPGRKALYRFTIRPSGIWTDVSENLQPFRHFGEIPGSPHYLVNAPTVVTEYSAERETDWLVWWQRYGMKGTGGRLVGLSPANATTDDFECLARRHEEGACFDRSSAVFAAWIGRKTPEDPGFSELVPADEQSRGLNGLSLVALRVHSCMESGNALCMVHARVNPHASNVVQQQEPLLIRDRFTTIKPSSSREQRRYQNFAMLPFVASGSSPDDPVLIWSKREESGTSSFRRAGVDRGASDDILDDTSVSRGSLRMDFAESDEPAFVIDRTADATVVASLLPSTAGTKLRLWRLPPTGAEANEPPFVRADDSACGIDLDRTWLARPPQLVRDSKETFLLFSRVAATADERPALELATIRIEPSGACTEKAELSRPYELPAGLTLSRLRKLPLLAGRLSDDDTLDVVLPTNEPVALCSLRDGRCADPPRTH